MAGELMDLKIARTGRVFQRIPVEKLRTWIAERRVLPDDLVRPVGGRNWLRVAVAPELAADQPTQLVEAPAPSGQRKAAGAPGATHAAADDSLGILAPAKSRPRRRIGRLEDAAMEMTPMIDVTFQLLIFFMFANQLANPNPIEVPEAQYGRGVMPDGKQAILIDEQGRYYLGESTKPENIAGSLDALVQEVADNASNVDGPLDVTISAHKQAVYLNVRELVEKLKEVDNLGTIRLGVEERQ